MLLSELSTDNNPFDISGTHTFNLQDLNLKGMYFVATMQLQQFREDLQTSEITKIYCAILFAQLTNNARLCIILCHA